MQVAIKRHRLFRIQDALTQLDAGYENGEGKKKTFQWKEGGKVRYAACRLLREVEGRIEDLNKVRSALIKDLTEQQEAEGVASPSAEAPLAPKYAQKFQTLYGDVLQEEESIEARPVPVDLFDLDKNPVPVTVLTALDGVLVQFPDE